MVDRSIAIENKNPPTPKGFLYHPAHCIALGFGAGYMPKMPGTAGTLVGILLYYPIASLSLSVYFLLTTIFFFIGVYLCHITTQHLGVHDHSAIVFDEIVGFLVTMYAVPNDWRFILLGFVLFRLFDILKPFPIGWLDRRVTSGWGIMLDDVLAGLYSLLILQIIIYLL